MLARLGARPTPGGPIRAAIARRALPLALGSFALAVVAIRAAAAFPSSERSAVTIPAPPPAPPAYMGGAAAMPAATDVAEDSTEARFSGRVGADLTQALQAAGVPERSGREYVALLRRAIDLNGGLSVEDKFDLVLQRETGGQLGQLIYAGLDRVARADVELLKWTDGKHVIWVNADGVGGEAARAMRLPVSGHVTSSFGERFHPILGYARMHKGVDLGAAMGAPIVAAADGKVVAAGWRGGYGRQVAILHGGGIETTYSHMSRMVAYPGEAVRQGQVIGYVGSSGLSTGPHVHYEVLKNGRPVNPMSVKLGGGPGQLEGEKLRQFQDALRSVLMLKSS